MLCFKPNNTRREGAKEVVSILELFAYRDYVLMYVMGQTHLQIMMKIHLVMILHKRASRARRYHEIHPW
jgi:hypothetical protein